MAEDIKIKLGAEADGLFAQLRKAENELKTLIMTANKTESAIGQIDDEKINLDTKQAQNELDALSKKADGVTKGGIDKAGFWGAALGGALGTIGGMGIQAAIGGIQNLGRKIVDSALAADEFGDTMEVAFKQQGIADVEGELEKVRKSTLGLANDLGLPVQRTRELASTVATMGGVSGKQAEELTKLSAGLEVFSGGAVKGEAVALAFSKGLADPEGAAAIERLAKKYPQLAETLRSNIDPAEKMKVANELLGESFKTVADQQGDAGGQMNQLSNIANEAFEKIGSGVYDALGPLLKDLMPVLSEGIPKAMQFVMDIFSQAKDIITNAFAGAGGPAIDFSAIISNVADILKTTFLAALENLMGLLRTVWNLAVYAFEQISDAIKPLMERMGGLEGITNGVKEVFKFLYAILEPIGKFLIDVLVFNVGLLVTGFTLLWDAGMAVYNFFANLDAIGRGVGAMFNSLVGTLGEVWRAITSFNWDDIGNIMANGFTNAKNAYNDAYNASKKTGEQQRAEVKKTEDAMLKSNEVIKKQPVIKLPVKPPGGLAPKQPKQEKKTEEASDLEKLKKLYEKESKELESKFNREKIAAEKNGEDLKSLENRQQAERSKKLSEFLNERFANVKDANRVLTNEELLTIIKPSEEKGETVQDVTSFYLAEIQKNQKGLTIEAKLIAEVQVASLKDASKEWADSVKVFESTMQTIVPKALATTQESLKSTIEQVNTFVGYLQEQRAEIEGLLATATAKGQTDIANNLQDSLNKITEQSGTLTSRLKDYEKKSLEEMKKGEEEKDVVLMAALSIKEGMMQAFDFRTAQAEKEQRQKALEEQRKGFNEEEKNIQNSFAKREMTFDEYAAGISAINKKRQETEQNEQDSFLGRLKTAGDKAAGVMFTKSGDLFKKMSKDMKGGEKVMFESFANLASKFGELAASGKATLKDFAGAAIDIAVNALMEMIPIWTAQIFGTSVAQMGIAGLAVAAGLQAALIGLVFAARSAGGFKDGVVELQGEGTETSDSIPAWLSKGESVITAKATRQNKQELEWINKTGKPLSEYYSEKQQINLEKQEIYLEKLSNLFVDKSGSLQAFLHTESKRKNTELFESVIIRTTSMEANTEMLQEIKELRKDTQNLGKSISHKTTVDIQGELRVDNKHITALVENNRRKLSRRG